MSRRSIPAERLRALQGKIEDHVREYDENEALLLKSEDRLTHAVLDLVKANDKYTCLPHQTTPEVAMSAFKLYSDICKFKLEICYQYDKMRRYQELCEEAGHQIGLIESDIWGVPDRRFSSLNRSGYAWVRPRLFEHNPKYKPWADTYRHYTEFMREYEISGWFEFHKEYLAASFERNPERYSSVFEDNGLGDWWKTRRSHRPSDHRSNTTRRSEYAAFTASFTTRDGRSVDPSQVSNMNSHGHWPDDSGHHPGPSTKPMPKPMPTQSTKPREQTSGSRASDRHTFTARGSESSRRPRTDTREQSRAGAQSWPYEPSGAYEQPRTRQQSRPQEQPSTPSRAARAAPTASAAYDITPAIANAWHDRCASVLAEHAKSTFPELPAYKCSQRACAQRASARANRQCCEHGIQKLFRLAGGKKLKAERLRWHPDRWAAAKNPARVAEYQAKAQEIFVALNAVV